jgi:osmoprotectant transport system permease protein
VIFAGPNSWIWWDWIGDHTDDIYSALREHLLLTVVAVAAGFVLSLPLAIVAHLSKWVRGPILLVAGVLYTIPSIAAFALLVGFTGLTLTTALIPLVTYTLFIFVRSILGGLDAVPPAVLDAADGMGFRRSRRLVRVELPLALPSIIAGLRLATVTTVGLVTVTAIISYGGFGKLIYDGFGRNFRTPVVVGSVLSVALAVALDLVIVGAGRLLMPWTRGGSDEVRATDPIETRLAVGEIAKVPA